MPIKSNQLDQCLIFSLRLNTDLVYTKDPWSSLVIVIDAQASITIFSTDETARSQFTGKLRLVILSLSRHQLVNPLLTQKRNRQQLQEVIDRQAKNETNVASCLGNETGECVGPELFLNLQLVVEKYL